MIDVQTCHLVQLLFIFCSVGTVLPLPSQLLNHTDPSWCKDDEYFDATSLLCVRCDTRENLVPSSDRLRCVCDRLSKMTDYRNGNPVCTACGINSVATADGYNCISCKGERCDCAENELRVERDIDGSLSSGVRCLSCSENSYLSSDRTKCVPCNNIIYNVHASCSCPAASRLRIHEYCLGKDDFGHWPDTRATYLVKFQSQSIDSYYFRTELQASMYYCKKGDKLFCERLSNMCALTLFDSGVPCTLFAQRRTSPLWLFYDSEESSAALHDKQISQIYSLGRHDDNGVLDFTLATFALSGELRSIGTPNVFCNILRNIRFGANVKRRCTISVSDLLSSRVEFFSPYLTFRDGERTFLHAIPVLIKSADRSYTGSAQLPLVRKFFLIDNTSGIRTLPGFSNGKFKRSSNLSVLRYVGSLSVTVNVRNGKDRGKIFPPMIVIAYKELTAGQLLATSNVVIDYSVSFTLSDSHLDADIKVSVAVLSGVALVFSTVKAWSHWKRDHNTVLNAAPFFWFAVYSVGAIGNVLLLAPVGFCVYVFVFYKGQSVPYVLLPSGDTERHIELCIVIAFAFKLIEVVGFLYRQYHISIFFIDWEQPRTVHGQFTYDSPRTSLNKTYSRRFRDTSEIADPSATPSDVIAAKRARFPLSVGSNRKSSPARVFRSPVGNEQVSNPSKKMRSGEAVDKQSLDPPVSIWRTYFIANEWLKLQTDRRTSVLLQSTCTVFILEVVGLHRWALAVPELVPEKEEKEEQQVLHTETSRTLQLAICTVVYVSVYILQWVVSIALYERYIKNKLERFVDLCSVANISVLILTFNYYGHYIHGRSVHGFADTDLATLVGNLQREENDLCAHRGLVPGTTEQTFIVTVTQTFRKAYNDLFERRNDGVAEILRDHTDDAARKWKETTNARAEINNFLRRFVDRCAKEEDYVIKERRIGEKLCDIILADDHGDTAFYYDNARSFDRATLRGNEWSMVTLEVAIFVFVLTARANYILASIVTAFGSSMLATIVKRNGKRCLSNKALLDKRFLT